MLATTMRLMCTRAAPQRMKRRGSPRAWDAGETWGNPIPPTARHDGLGISIPALVLLTGGWQDPVRVDDGYDVT